jgi:hypothetical protein
LFPLHVSPSVAHVVLGFTQRPPVHWLPQHCTFEVHAAPAIAQLVAFEHLSVDGSQ